MTGAANNETSGTSGDRGARPPQADVIQPDDGTQCAGVSQAGKHHRPWNNSRQRFSKVRPDPADLGALAREAVVSFLHDASIATAEREAVRGETATAGTGPDEAEGIPAADELLPGQVPGQVPGQAAADASRVDAESVAWQAASVSLATLDRIEAAAASIEADIRAALQKQADLQAGAGAAAEAAVSAAASAWQAEGRTVEAEGRVKVAARRVEHIVAITFILLIIAMILVIAGATPLG